MAKFKIRKGVKIGALAAENDQFLDSAFVDLGLVDGLVDTLSPQFLVLGRTGSGKTALLERIRRNEDHVSKLDPDELSMQYLHNSSPLRTISAWGVNLEIFYKYLWRHVCILELIRMRYGDAEDVPSKIQQLFPLAQISKAAKTREASQQYLRQFGDDYWIKTDTRIKNITSEIESQLTQDPKIAASIGIQHTRIEASAGVAERRTVGQKVEQEVVQRAQEIVSDFQIAALNRVVELLSEHGFKDQQKNYYLTGENICFMNLWSCPTTFTC